jgi:hypothetical protein
LSGATSIVRNSEDPFRYPAIRLLLWDAFWTSGRPLEFELGVRERSVQLRETAQRSRRLRGGNIGLLALPEGNQDLL